MGRDVILPRATRSVAALECRQQSQVLPVSSFHASFAQPSAASPCLEAEQPFQIKDHIFALKFQSGIKWRSPFG